MTGTRLLEKHIETYLRKKVKEAGGKAYKFVSPMQRSVPDRLCIFPGGHIYFVEVKRPGGKLTKGQVAELEFLRDMGCNATTVWSKRDVRYFLSVVAKDINLTM